ncbi:PREDICTED: transmembrane protein 213 isoform X1 [Hipposideros armiger]|uniref:Transmembrane protein 213 isoform X1 n=1 Tax=Hipposideros armiger TaxID=186990 RepID=A0A8B7S665_HIPAR|nr:PREDICTED: transmembrane protein 213 isoform X1 [Hipposideros armiger]
MAPITQHTSDASLSSMRHLISAARAALVLSLVFASFHSARWAEASSDSNSTLTTHHPNPETLEQCLSSPSLVQVVLMTQPQDSSQRCRVQKLVEVGQQEDHKNQRVPCLPKAGVSFCTLCIFLFILYLNTSSHKEAARCCHIGVDEYGWIMAAVGWSLWFLTLILLCVDKLMKVTPDEPKDLQA